MYLPTLEGQVEQAIGVTGTQIEISLNVTISTIQHANGLREA